MPLVRIESNRATWVQWTGRWQDCGRIRYYRPVRVRGQHTRKGAWLSNVKLLIIGTFPTYRCWEGCCRGKGLWKWKGESRVGIVISPLNLFMCEKNFSPPSLDFPLGPVDRKRGRCQEAKKRSVRKIWAQAVKGFTLDAPRFWKPQGQAGQNDLPTPHLSCSSGRNLVAEKSGKASAAQTAPHFASLLLNSRGLR